MSISNRMDYLEDLYNYHEGNVHRILNQYDLDGDDFDFLIKLKEYYNE